LKFIEDTHSIPKEYDEKLQIFEKLLLVKALKPHYIRRFLIEYVQDRAMRHSTQNKVIKSMTTEK
jgi:dynein heavy chain